MRDALLLFSLLAPVWGLLIIPTDGSLFDTQHSTLCEVYQVTVPAFTRLVVHRWEESAAVSSVMLMNELQVGFVCAQPSCISNCYEYKSKRPPSVCYNVQREFYFFVGVSASISGPAITANITLEAASNCGSPPEVCSPLSCNDCINNAGCFICDNRQQQSLLAFPNTCMSTSSGTCPVVLTDASQCPTCPAGTVDCAGSCVDVRTNPRHCGNCGQPCSSGFHCHEYVCRERSTTTEYLPLKAAAPRRPPVLAPALGSLLALVLLGKM
eukprot:TRINITY_DN5887_c0_g1_i1.p1 TRINITY_DN5887_c0_g1~~TRINITY_DN5887_c0_g1_i1.p1  ORF type:complete len:282 (+),score=57.39 TRINITY_DN5887_c0_g1_i1:44-847(+)